MHPLILIGLVATAVYPVRTPNGYVVFRSVPQLIDTLGVGPGACFARRCAPGVILRRNGSGALFLLTAEGRKEVSPFRFDIEDYQKLTVEAANIRHRGLPCKPQVTDGGGASIFWSAGDQRIEIHFTNGCPNKDDRLVIAFYDRVMALAEVKAAMSRFEAAR